MIPFEDMTDEQFERFALELLQKELGAYGVARFLRSVRMGMGDYTRDRLEWQRDLTIDQILEESRKVEFPAAG